jgi:hypothetical protein
MLEANQKLLESGTPNRKVSTLAAGLSCNNNHFTALTNPDQSTGCQFFTDDYLI